MALLSVGALPFSLPSYSLSNTHSSRLSFSKTETLAAASFSLRAHSASLTVVAPLTTAPDSIPSLLVYCGRGDKKTAKGKRFKHSFGNCRPRNKKKGRGPPRPPMTPSAPRKDKFDDGEVVKIDIDESLFS